MARGQGDRAAGGLVCLQASLLEQVASEHAVNDLQHGRYQLRLRGQQQAQRDRQRQHPLAHRHMGDDVVDQVGRRLRHAPCAARGAKAAPLATEGDELVVAAVPAAQPQEAVGQDAALQKSVELVLDELRQVGPGGGFGLGEEGRGVLLHQAVQRGLLGAVALVVNGGTLRYQGGSTGSLHALLTPGRPAEALSESPASAWPTRRATASYPPTFARSNACCRPWPATARPPRAGASARAPCVGVRGCGARR